jgi:hypothetical protein
MNAYVSMCVHTHVPLLHITSCYGRGRHCAFLLLWPEAHVQRRTGDAGGERICGADMCACYMLQIITVMRVTVPSYFCGLKRMYSSVLEMLEANNCVWFCVCVHTCDVTCYMLHSCNGHGRWWCWNEQMLVFLCV